MKTIKELEKDLKDRKELIRKLLKKSDMKLMNAKIEDIDPSYIKTKEELRTKKEVCKLIEKKINNIATNPKELALAGHKRACCMMTLKELLNKIKGK